MIVWGFIGIGSIKQEVWHF